MKMLKKLPQERISPTDALNHPFFSSMEEEEDEEETDIVGELSKKNSSSTEASKGYPSCDSPLLTTSNPARRLDKTLKKDSCVDFRMGKENVFTGKVDTLV